MGDPQRTRASTLLFYALPALALAIPTIPVYVFMPAFYAETVGLGLTATGAILLVARLIDVVTDPIIGIASDRLTIGRWGRRKPWIAVGGVICAVSLLQILQPPEGTSSGFLLLWSIALYIGWTMVAVPYTAWGAELSGDYHERARITGAREALMIVGVLLAGAIPSVVASAGGSERQGLAAVAWLAVAIGVPAIALMLWRVPDAGFVPQAGSEAKFTWLGIRQMIQNRPFNRLLGAWFVNGLANGFPAVLFPLYLKHALEATPEQQGILISAYFAAGVIAIPGWLWLSRRLGKHRSWCVAMMIACAAFVWVPLLETQAIMLFLIICIVTGTALGADVALPPAIQADVVDYDTLRSGKRRAGLFFAIWSMSTKLALALAVGLAFPALGALGFRTDGINTAEAILALALIYAFVPTVLKCVAIAIMWRHPIDLRRQTIIKRRIDRLEPRQQVRL